MNGRQRPVINLYGNEAIIDTGAIIPMVSFSKEIVKLAWNADLVKSDIEIGGIGGKTKGSIYTLHNFQIGDLIFDDLDVFISDIPTIKYSFLLSATMFYGTNFSFEMINSNNQNFIVEVPDDFDYHIKFKIIELKGDLYAQINGVLIQEDHIELYDIANYSQTDISYYENDEYDEYDFGDR